MKASKAYIDYNDDDWDIILIGHYSMLWDLMELQGIWGNIKCRNCGKMVELVFHEGVRSRCPKCRKTYSPLSSTIFANSKTWLPFWIRAIYLVKEEECRAINLVKVFKCTYKTAWKIFQKIKSMDEASIENALYLKYKDEFKDEPF